MPINVSEEKPGIFVARFQTPEARIDFEFIKRFHEILDTVESHKGSTALVLTNSGKYFSNGLKFEVLAADPEKLLVTFHQLMKRLITFCVPTIAILNGHAFAGGAMLAYCCDWRYFNDSKGFICLNEVDIGLNLTPGMAAVMTSKIDRSMWADLVLNAFRFDAKSAIEHGLVDFAFPPERLFEEGMKFAESVAARGKNKAVYHDLKREIWGAVVHKLDSGIGFAESIAANLKKKSLAKM